MLASDRRRSSAGYIFAIGAAALAALPIVGAAPASSPSLDGSLSGWDDSFSDIRERHSRPDIYERSGDGWRNRRDGAKAARRSSGKTRMARRSMERVHKARQSGACLDSTYTEDDINTLLWQGGPNTKVQLCPGATLQLEGPIVYSAQNQEISTQGYPKGSSRAKLQITGSSQEVAIWMNCDQCIGTSIRNIEIDGARPALGWIAGGSCAVEMGGNAYYQTIDNSYVHDPRGWCAVHVIEGYQNSCKSQVLTNNQIGPAGTAPNNAQQFSVVSKKLLDFIPSISHLVQKRQTQAPGRWADGLSVACRNTTVSGNVITGATDGGIVLFGSPGSRITGNTITARDNTLLGGINMVDHGPFNGDYSGSTISGNTIISDNAMIKVGVAVGLMAWGSYNVSTFRTQGGSITNNVFKSNGGTGYFGYGIAVGGHNNAVVSGNNFNGALFGGTRSYACDAGAITPPFQAAIWSPYTTSGGSYQSGITSLVDFSFLICTMPCQYDATCAATMKLTGPVPVAAVSTTSTTSSSTSSTTSSTSSSTSTTRSSSSSSTSTSTISSTSQTTSSATKSTQTTSTTTSTSTSSKTSTSAKVTLSLARPTLSLARDRAPALAKTSSAQVKLQTAAPATLAIGRGAGKRSIAEIAGEASSPTQSLNQQNFDLGNADLYRDWMLPGGDADQIAESKRSFVEQHGFDKREVLADPVYWEE